jgi:DnaJ-domain-containing protein 1
MIAPARPTADLTADILLRCRREPSRYRNEMQRDDAPAVNPDVVVRLALGSPVRFVDPELSRPRIASELKEAAAQFVQQVFFRPDATPYQVLGVGPDASQETIKETYRLLMQLVHPDRQGDAAPWPETFAARVNRAYGTLRDPELRAAYQREAEARAGRAAPSRRAEAPPAAGPIPAGAWRRRRGAARPAATRSRCVPRTL